MKKRKLDKFAVFGTIFLGIAGIFLFLSAILWSDYFNAFYATVKPIGTQGFLFGVVNKFGYTAVGILAGIICLGLAGVIVCNGSLYVSETSDADAADKP